MPDSMLLWRLLKFVAIAVFTAGLSGAVFSRSQARRIWSLQVVATVGLILTWIAGYGMTKALGLRFSEPWIGMGIVTSFFAWHEAAAIAHRSRVRPINVGLLVAFLSSSFGAMVVRGGGTAQHVVTIGLPLAAGALATLVATRTADAWDYEPGIVKAKVRWWFVWIARVEGASLLTLLGVYMPLKYGAGIVLDGGQGWFGWVHGVMAILFMQALWSGFRRLGWDWRRVGLGFVASLVPFGTFVFERYLPKHNETEDKQGTQR